MTNNVTKSAIKTLNIADTDTNVIPQMQVSMYGASKTIGRLGQYGVYGNAPSNSLVTVLQINGQEECLYGIEDDVNNRPRGLKDGEIMLYNTITKNYVFLKEDGSTEIFANTNLELKITGTVYLQAEKTIINGDVDINGNVNVVGTLRGDVIEAGNGADISASDTVTSIKGIVVSS